MKSKQELFLRVKGVGLQMAAQSVLESINFTQKELQKIAIAGQTGSGKSSLLKIIAGLLQPDQGEVLFCGATVAGPADRLVAGNPEIAYLSQHFELAKSLRVEQVLSYARKVTEAQSRKIYKVCRITHLLLRRTDELSGGERQRIALAQVLVRLPKLLLLDEPYSNLDIIHRNILKEVIDEIGTQLNITTILVSHDPVDILSWADEVIVLKNGRIVQQGIPQVVYQQPVNEYVAGLLGGFNVPGPSLLKQLFPNPVAKGKKIILRPEQLEVSKKKTMLAAVISQKKFCGSYYELTLVAGDEKLIAHTTNDALTLWDDVWIQVKNGHDVIPTSPASTDNN